MKRLGILFLVAAMVFTLTVPCLAASSEPIVVDGVSFPVETGDNGNIIDWFRASSHNHVVVYKLGASYRMWLTTVDIYSKDTTQGTMFTGVHDNGAGKAYRYTLVNNEWVYNDTVSQPSGYDQDLGTYDSIIFASDTITHGKDSGVVIATQHPRFLLALSEVVTEVTGEQMEKTLPALVGTMKTLVLCGVGLMALLVVLKLFGKRSLIFLRR